MSDWCVCGHGSHWHQPREGGPYEWSCKFSEYHGACACQKFDEADNTWDVCDDCGHPYSGGDWSLGHKKGKQCEHLYCACKEFKPHPFAKKLRLTFNLSDSRILRYDPTDVLVSLHTKKGVELKGRGYDRQSLGAWDSPVVFQATEAWDVDPALIRLLVEPNVDQFLFELSREVHLHRGEKVWVKMNLQLFGTPIAELQKNLKGPKEPSLVQMDGPSGHKRIVEV